MPTHMPCAWYVESPTRSVVRRKTNMWHRANYFTVSQCQEFGLGNPESEVVPDLSQVSK